MSSTNCTYCGKSGKQLRCTCGNANYCNKECQVSDWKNHKPTHKLTDNKINVVLLGENHIDEKCFFKNAQKLSQILVKNEKPMNKQEFLLVSEGNGINPCYQGMGLPTDRIIIEDDQPTTPLESMIDRLLLQQQLVFSIKNGEIHRNEKFSETVIINEAWMMKRATSGFNELLKSIKCEELYEQMINNAFQNKDINDIFKEILTRISIFVNSASSASSANSANSVNSASGGGATEVAPDPDVSDKTLYTMLNDLITTNTHTNFNNLKPLLNYFRESRDKKIIKRVEERINKEPSIKIVIIIFGQLHFQHLKKVIEESRYLKFDSTNSMQLEGFRLKYLKYKQKYLSLKNFIKNN